MSTKQEDDDEEELNIVDNSASTRRAYYAGRDFGRAEAGTGLESGGFRGVPTTPHGGSQYVKPEDTLGSMDVCGACGGPFDHDWPGKALGVPHPRTNKEPVAMTTPSTTPPPERIQRKQLRGYHADVADVVITAVNQYGVKFAIRGSKLLLYPPDGTNPLSVRTGTNEGERKRVQAWFVRHCVPEGMTVQDVIKRNKQATVEKVDQEVIKELAETMNSEEHLPPPVKATKPEPVKPEPVEEDERETPKLDALMASPEWVPYFVGRGKGHEDAPGTQHPHMETNGVYDEEGRLTVRCTLDGWVGTNRGVGGHTRTNHRDTSDLHGPEARDKSRKTYYTTKMKAQLEQAYDLLQTALGIEPAQVDTEELEMARLELKKARQQVDALRKENGVQGAKIVELGTEVTNLKAKVALLREAFTALEE